MQFSSRILLLPLTLFALGTPAVAQLAVGQDEPFTSVNEARELEARVIELIDRTRPAIVGVEISFLGSGGRRGSIAGGS